MNPHLLIVVLGMFYVVVIGGLSLLRREGLSMQFAIEVLALTALAEIVALLMNTTIEPVLFLIFIYLLSMRGRILVDFANMFSNRGRQKNAISLLQLALRLFPDRSTRMVILVNMGIVQLRRKNPESAQELFEMVLNEAKDGGLGVKFEAACRYNLGLALQKQGKEAQAVQQFSEVVYVFPNSIYSQAAEAALEKRRRGQSKTGDTPPEEN